MQGDGSFSIFHCDCVISIKSVSFTSISWSLSIFRFILPSPANAVLKHIDWILLGVKVNSCSYSLYEFETWTVSTFTVYNNHFVWKKFMILRYVFVDSSFPSIPAQPMEIYLTHLLLECNVYVFFTCIRLSFDDKYACAHRCIFYRRSSFDRLFVYLFVCRCVDVTSLYTCVNLYGREFCRHLHDLKHKIKMHLYWAMSIIIIECTIKWKHWCSSYANNGIEIGCHRITASFRNKLSDCV